MDGASSALGARVGIVVITPEGIKLEHSFRLTFRASNNEAKYEALLAGLKVISNLGAKEVEVYSDSRLVVNQVQGSFEEIPQLIKVELVAEPSINTRVCVLLATTVRPCWMDLIIDFLAMDRMSTDEKEVEKAC